VQEYYRKLDQAREYIESKLKVRPDTALILGSGLGSLADDIYDRNELFYAEIPNFPVSTVEGHSGMLLSGKLWGKPVIAMKGRFHYYEGYDMQEITFPIRVFKLLGIKNLVVTNAAGAVNTGFKPGDLMIIEDHISFFAPSALRGRNPDRLGPRFPDMSGAYDKGLIRMTERSSQIEGIEIKKGIYAFTQGPMYETPAEIKALRALGADAVGMSTVPEVITARHSGIKVLGISCITNMAAGILDKPLNHDEVVEMAKKAEGKFRSLIKGIFKEWKGKRQDSGSCAQ